MATKRPNLKDTQEGRAIEGTAKKKAAQQFETVFVNYSLSAQEKDQCKLWCPTLDELDTELYAVCRDLFKVTVKYDAYSDGYAAWLVPHNTNTELAGMILSGRGSTPIKAVRQVLFLHNMMGGDWGSYAVTKKEFSFDD